MNCENHRSLGSEQKAWHERSPTDILSRRDEILLDICTSLKVGRTNSATSPSNNAHFKVSRLTLGLFYGHVDEANISDVKEWRPYHLPSQ